MNARVVYDTIEPATVQKGLAVYDVGQGEPLLLLPYPHGYTLRSMAEGELAHLLVGLGRRVLTFDPPGAYRSTRPAQVTMPEMLGCALETLDVRGVSEAVDLAGHSMGGLCALAFSLEHPERVKRLVLIDTISGGPAVVRWGWQRHYAWWSADFWRYIVWGFRLMRGGGSLALHKRHAQLLSHASYVDKSKVPKICVEEGDERRPPPVRDRWAGVARKLDYSGRLGQVRAPTLVCVGRHDPQTPLPCSEELVQGIPDARLVVFERSGHSPFVEEPARFAAEVAAFMEEV